MINSTITSYWKEVRNMSIKIRDTILLVDGSAERRDELRRIFDEKFNILEARNFEQAEFLGKLNCESIIAVIISIELFSEETSLAVKQSAFSDIPFVAIIDEQDTRGEYFALEYGASDTISYPFYPEIVSKRVSNLIMLNSHKWNLNNLVKEQEEAMMHSNQVMVDALISIIESRSMESAQHILRIRRFTQILLEVVAKSCPEYRLTEETIGIISSAASLHDIGKITIADSILNKAGKLTDEEYDIMKTHTTAGCGLLQRVEAMGNDMYMRYAYNICRYHHERWDGRGYPDGLSGDDIPICAQVVGIADVYDALTTERVYKKAYSYTDAANMILRGDCGVFSPKLLECFKLVMGQFEALAKMYSDGYSPTSDSITIPLEAPARAADNGVQNALAKYNVLLHHLNATVVEIDIDSELFHVVYNPNPELMILNSAVNLKKARELLTKEAVHPDDRDIAKAGMNDDLWGFFESELRKRVLKYRLKRADGSYSDYNVTALRLNDSPKTRRALLIWEPVSETTSSAVNGARADFSESEACGIPVSILNDRWLTISELPDELCSLLGYTAAEMAEIHKNRFTEVIIPIELDDAVSRLREQLAIGVDVTAEFPVYHKNSSVVWLLLKGKLTLGADGFEYIDGVLFDTTAAKSGNSDLVSFQQFYRLVVEQSGDAMFLLDIKDDKIIFRGAERNGNTTKVTDLALLHPDDIAIFRKEIEALKRGGKFTEFNVRIANATRRYSWFRVRVATRFNREGGVIGMIGSVICVDNERSLFSNLDDNADRDPLTKLLNSDAAKRQIDVRLENSNMSLSALLIIDLDNFKEINKLYGHLYGDTILMRVASEISWMFRGTDVTSRIGGDEFLVFMNNIPDRSLVENRCAALIGTIQSICREYLKNSDFTCSVGVALAPYHGENYKTLLQNADRALYHAKQMGKNRYAIYDSSVSGNVIATMVNRRIDSDKDMGLAGNNLSHYVFNRLYESGDFEGTINSLIEIVGRQLNVSRVYIFENNADNTECSNTFEWCNVGISSEKDNLQNVSYITDIPGYQDLFDNDGIFYVPDVTKLAQHLQDILGPQNICSMLQCAIMDNGQFRGYVGFDDNNSARLWTKEQIDILVLLSQTISLFLLRQRGKEETTRTFEDIQNVLNSQYSWTYIVEPETYEIKFLNRRAMELVPYATVGEKCYKVFMNRDTPCQNCPIVVEGVDKTTLIKNPHLNLDVSAHANSIHWHGKNAWLLMCRNTETK